MLCRHQLISNLPHLKSIDGELIISSDESSSEEEDSDSEVSSEYFMIVGQLIEHPPSKW